MLESLFGGAAGGAAGGYLGSQGRGPGISDLLAPLDFPRQALANLGRGVYRGVTGEGTWEDLLGALPGAAGILAGALTGGAGSVLAGGLMGGLAQGAGKMSGHGAFEAPETSHMLEALGGDPEDFLQNLALGAATDPLTYAGFGPGARAGKAIRGGKGNLSGYHSGVPASLFGEDALTGTAGRAELAGMTDFKTGRPLGYLPTPPRHASAVSKELEVLGVTPHGGGGEVNPALAAMQAEHEGAQGALRQALGERGPYQPFARDIHPEEYERQLNNLYAIARDFEQDAEAGLAGLVPRDVLTKRYGMWDDIFRREAGFYRRQGLGADVMLGDATGMSRPNARAWEIADRRNFPPEVRQQLVEHGVRGRGEQNLAPYFTDPAFDQLRIHGGHGGRRHGGEVVTEDLERLIGRAGANAVPDAVHEAAYAKFGQPTFRLRSGRMPPAEAQSLLDELLGRGYPLNREAALNDYARLNTMRMQALPENLAAVKEIIGEQQRRGGGMVGQMHRREELAHLEELINQLLGPAEGKKAIIQAYPPWDPH